MSAEYFSGGANGQKDRILAKKAEKQRF